ncbi:MAG: PAS domain-containing protein [Deltaproteobacteria bacterium]
MRFLLDRDIRLYQELIEAANVVIVAFDAKGHVLIWNKAAVELTGYSLREATGPTHIVERLYPDVAYRQNVLTTIGSAVKNPFKDVEWTLRTKRGEKRCVSWSGIPVKGRGGAVLGSFAIGIDVTRRNAVKERERESFRALLKAVRIHEAEKARYEEETASLKAEVNALCRELSRPPRYA